MQQHSSCNVTSRDDSGVTVDVLHQRNSAVLQSGERADGTGKHAASTQEHAVYIEGNTEATGHLPLFSLLCGGLFRRCSLLCWRLSQRCQTTYILAEPWIARRRRCHLPELSVPCSSVPARRPF